MQSPTPPRSHRRPNRHNVQQSTVHRSLSTAHSLKPFPETTLRAKPFVETSLALPVFRKPLSTQNFLPEVWVGGGGGVLRHLASVSSRIKIHQNAV